MPAVGGSFAGNALHDRVSLGLPPAAARRAVEPGAYASCSAARVDRRLDRARTACCETSHPPVVLRPARGRRRRACSSRRRAARPSASGRATRRTATRSAPTAAASRARRGPTRDPSPGFEAIRDAVAFYPALMDECTRRRRARASRRRAASTAAGSRATIVGPFKGSPARPAGQPEQPVVKRPPLYVLFDWIRFRSWFRRLYRADVRGRERIPARRRRRSSSRTTSR